MHSTFCAVTVARTPTGSPASASRLIVRTAFAKAPRRPRKQSCVSAVPARLTRTRTVRRRRRALNTAGESRSPLLETSTRRPASASRESSSTMSPRTKGSPPVTVSRRTPAAENESMSRNASCESSSRRPFGAGAARQTGQLRLQARVTSQITVPGASREESDCAVRAFVMLFRRKLYANGGRRASNFLYDFKKGVVGKWDRASGRCGPRAERGGGRRCLRPAGYRRGDSPLLDPLRQIPYDGRGEAMVAIIPKKDIGPEYLTDESRYLGHADSISFPSDAAELVETVGLLAASAVPFTVQGARTGITGGAVPEGGHILNLSRLTRIAGFAYDEAAGRFSITVEPGLTLAALGDHLRRKDFGADLSDPASQRAFERFRNSGRFFFPPDPTETTASLGGMVACNASGARSHRYGPTRDYVTGLTVVLSSGKTARLARGSSFARGREFTLALEGARAVAGSLPGYTFRALKNAAGYYVRDDMDLIDLFIGQEGTLGVVSAVTLGLLPEPAHTLGVLYFFKTEAQALDFVLRVRADAAAGSALRPSALEYFDKGALDVMAPLKSSAVRTPDPAHHAGVYVEVDDEEEERLYSYFEGLSGLVSLTGQDPDANWAGDSPAERESLRLFRHTVPEAVNARIAAARREAPAITKLGTDFAVGDDALRALVSLYRERLDAAGLDSVMFGHIGDNHLHVNVLPRTAEEYESGKKIFAGIAAAVVAMGGTVSGEHGIGKLKRNLLALMYGPDDIDDMKRLKRTFDPGFLLNRGNLFTLP